MRHCALDVAHIRGPVAVLMGGLSAEREVSLDSGGAVHAALARRLPGVLAIDAQADVLPRLIAAGVRHAFIALHEAVLGINLSEDLPMVGRAWDNYQRLPAPSRLVFGRNEMLLQRYHADVAEAVGMPLRPPA